MSWQHPILTCNEAADWEKKLLGGSDEKTRDAMKRAGEAVGNAAMRDYNEFRVLPRDPRILALIGKGHNGGDALHATLEILRQRPRGKAVLIFAFGETSLKPLAQEALAGLLQEKGDCIQTEYLDERIGGNDSEMRRMLDTYCGDEGFDFCIDGMLGMQFSPPLREPMATLVRAVNECPSIGMRVAVDVPSGVSDKKADLAFRADFTYATGIAKTPLFRDCNEDSVGRARYLDIGFFDERYDGEFSHGETVARECVLDPMRRLRPAAVDKRDFGHLFIVAGSREMPGALLMNVRAALRSGAGLVTAFAPESVAASFAAAAPEAMWVPWPETRNGWLDPTATDLITSRLDKATAVLMGSGMGQARETGKLVGDLVEKLKVPTVLDADALRPMMIDIITWRSEDCGPVVITPHLGEFRRIAGRRVPKLTADGLREYAYEHRLTLVLKSSVTRVADRERVTRLLSGGPVLARGGSGDLLGGIVAGMLAQKHEDTFAQVCGATLWHGLAADSLARTRGQTAATSPDLLAHLPDVLRAERVLRR